MRWPSSRNIIFKQSSGMKFTEVKNEGLEKHFKVTIPAKNLDGKVQDELQKLTKTVRMPGFRAGKVPLSIVQKKYSDAVRSDAISEEIRGSVDELIKQHNLAIVGTPSVDDLKSEAGKDLEFVVKFEIMPEITMPDFKKIKITKPVVELADKDLKEHLDRLADTQKSFAAAAKTYKAAEGDRVVIDFVGSIDGKEFDGGAAKGHEIVLGSKTFIPGFEDQLIGKKAGDEVLVKVNFPESYHAKDLAGKPSEFKVTLHEVQKPEATKIDDEFAKKVGCKDLEELKKRLSDSLLAGYNDQIHTIMKMDLFDKLESALKFDAPKSMAEREYEALKRQSEQFIASDESMKDKKPEDLDKYYRRVSLRRIKIGMMLAEYVKQKEIKIEQKDVQQAILAEARNFPGQESAVIDYYMKNQKAVESLSGPVMEEKAVRAIFDGEVALTEKKYSVAEIEKFIEVESDRDVL